MPPEFILREAKERRGTGTIENAFIHRIFCIAPAPNRKTAKEYYRGGFSVWLPQQDEFRNFLEEFKAYCILEEINKSYKDSATIA